MKKFTDEEQKHLFDEIYNMYFNRNFGSVSKADLETFLFSEYIDHCLNENESFDDYTLSKELGITQSRIRALKERKELKYPREEFDWKESFINELNNAKYDENDHYVKIIIQDVNVMTEVRHYIEEHGWYDECSLNKKLLRIPLSCFSEIVLDDENLGELLSNETERKIKKLGNDNSILNLVNNFTKDGLNSFLMSATKEVIIQVLSNLSPAGKLAIKGIDFLKKALKGM